MPEILAGADCIGVAQTGSGKTLAFALPIIQERAKLTLKTELHIILQFPGF